MKKHKLIISYSLDGIIGSTKFHPHFYKYLHNRLKEVYDLDLEYIPLEDLAERHKGSTTGKPTTNDFFNRFNFIIHNSKTDKYFVHSAHDYSVEALCDGLERGFNIVKFSCVPNIRSALYLNNKDKFGDLIAPSVYGFREWSDYKNIIECKRPKTLINKAYFKGLIYNNNNRAALFKRLLPNPFFKLSQTCGDSGNDEIDRIKFYKELAAHKYNLSFSGSAGICYRDNEIFGIGNFNLREQYDCLTYNPIEKNVHYIQLFEQKLMSKILDFSIDKNDIKTEITERINEVVDFCNSSDGRAIPDQALEWFRDNCPPDKQVDILYKIISESSILE